MVSEIMLNDAQKSVLLEIVRDAVRFDEPLTNYSTMSIGGPADALVVPRNCEMLKSVVQWAVENEVPYMFLGGGSDTLIRDDGVRGIVIRLKEGFNRLEVSHESGGDVFVIAEAGVTTGTLVSFAKENGFKGVEGLSGIPGTVGGNVMTNAGTSLGWISEVIEEATVVDRQIKELTIKRKALEFSYRRLKMPRSTAVVRALLKLKRDDPAAIEQRMKELLEKRKATQPHSRPTLGCIFKNPGDQSRVTPARQSISGGSHASRVVSAGRLIDEAGLKGVRVGGARVSEIHANFIINEGGATAKDVEILIGLIRENIKEKFGILLEPEIRIVGDN